MSAFRSVDPRAIPRFRAWTIYTRRDAQSKFHLFRRVSFTRPHRAGEVLGLIRHLTDEYDVMVSPEPQRPPARRAEA